jgi:hypothetical protein
MAYIDTTNMPLHMPVPGSREPAQIALLNENCVVIDAHDHGTGKGLAIGRLRSGLDANRPAAGTAGNVYFSTDTGRFYVDTGTAWVQFLTEGGQGTVTGWTLIDPVIRDTIQWGPEGSAAIDGSLSRTSAGELKWLSAGTTQFWIDSGTGDASSGIMFSRSGSNRWFQQIAAEDADSPYIFYDYGTDGSLFLERMRITHDTDAQLGHIMFQGGNPTNRSYLNIRFRDGARSWVEMKSESSAGLMRFGQPVGGATNAGFWITSNCDYSAAGSNWNRDDVSKGAWNVSAIPTDFAINFAPAAANPITAFKQRLGINAAGTATLTPDAGARSLVLMSDILMNGTIQHQVGGSENLAGSWLCSANGTRQVFLGLEAGMDNQWRIYSATSGGAGNRLTFNMATGSMVILPVGANTALQWGGGRLRQDASGNPFIDGMESGFLHLGGGHLGGICHVAPKTDNASNFGWPDRRWVTIFAVTGSINTSHVSMKRDFAPLDPAACAAAVEATDWLSFTYNPPTPPERPEGADDAAWASQQESYQQMLAETDPARRSKGYVLGSDEYKTADLFGTVDRKSGQATADLAVVACALQDALRRLAALEGKSGNAAAA